MMNDLLSEFQSQFDPAPKKEELSAADLFLLKRKETMLEQRELVVSELESMTPEEKEKRQAMRTAADKIDVERHNPLLSLGDYVMPTSSTTRQMIDDWEQYRRDNTESMLSLADWKRDNGFTEAKPSAIQPSKEFEDIDLYFSSGAYQVQTEIAEEQIKNHLAITPPKDYRDSMPAGLREAQLRNGVGVEKGNFEWENGNKDGKIVFIPDPNGKFEIISGVPNSGKTEMGYHCAFDPYKPDSNESSVIIARDQEKILAVYEGRPEKEKDFMNEVEKISEYYGCKIEEEPFDFKVNQQAPFCDPFVIVDIPESTEFEIKRIEPEQDFGQVDLFGSMKEVQEPHVPAIPVIPSTPMLDKALNQADPGDWGAKLPTGEIIKGEFKTPTPDAYNGNDQNKFHIDEVSQFNKLNLSFKEQLSQLGMGEIPSAPFGIKPKAWAGVDPGKSGGIVLISEKGLEYKWIIPLIGKDVDAQGIWDILQICKDKFDVTLILEEVHSLHKMSASTNFSMGHTLGLILGIVIASKIKLIRVQPKAWQKRIWISSEIEYLPKKPDQVNPSINTKLTSMKAAIRLFPNADFRKSSRATNPHDGITDACCMAEYGRIENL